MVDRELVSTGRADDQFQKLTRELIQEIPPSPEIVLQRSLDLIASTQPFAAAAALSGDLESERTRWIQFDGSGNGNDVLHRVASENPDILRELLQGDDVVQQNMNDLMSDAPWDNGVLIGIPSGRFNDAPSGIVMIASRELTGDEISRLTPLARIVGTAAENARLNDLVLNRDGQNPIAGLIGLIAHELRTPLTGMRGNIQLALMSNRKGNNERIPGRLEAAIGVIDDMATLVQKLLDVSRIERGTYQFQEEQADLRATLAEAIRDLESAETGPETRVVLAEGERVEHRHDEHAMKIGVTYLLQALLKKIGEEGQVVVQVKSSEGEARVTFSYQGDRISRSEESALSSPLYGSGKQTTADDDPDRELQLELAFSGGVVRHHQGEFEFHGAVEIPDEQTITIHFPASAC